MGFSIREPLRQKVYLYTSASAAPAAAATGISAFLSFILGLCLISYAEDHVTGSTAPMVASRVESPTRIWNGSEPNTPMSAEPPTLRRERL